MPHSTTNVHDVDPESVVVSFNQYPDPYGFGTVEIRTPSFAVTLFSDGPEAAEALRLALIAQLEEATVLPRNR